MSANKTPLCVTMQCDFYLNPTWELREINFVLDVRLDVFNTPTPAGQGSESRGKE